MALRYNFAPTSRSERTLAWVFSFPLRCGVMVNSDCSMRCARRQTQGTETEKEVMPLKIKNVSPERSGQEKSHEIKLRSVSRAFSSHNPWENEKKALHTTACATTAQNKAQIPF